MLYQILCTTFCVIVVISNIISAKMVPISFLDSLSIPAGLLTYPLTFFISGLVTEIFGTKKARLMVYLAFATTLLSYGIIQIALILPGNDTSFREILGLNGIIIGASLTAYFMAQLIEIYLYAAIKKWTGPRFLWLRNNGSTLAAQIVDTIVVNTIYLHWGLGIEMALVVPVMIISYVYKASFSLLNTPIYYLSVFWAKKNIPLEEHGSR